MMFTITDRIFETVRGQGFFVQESSQLSYGEDSYKFPSAHELMKAQLLVELLDKYHYASDHIEIGGFVLVQEDPIRYAEVDVMVRNASFQPFIVCMVEVPGFYEQNFELAMQKLFSLAALLGEKESFPQFLVYYTRLYEGMSRIIRQVVVNCSAYQTFDAWNKADRPIETDIPSYTTTKI